MTSPAIFLDKDGTLLADVPYNVEPEQMRLAPGVEPGLAILAQLDLPMFVISNQSGVALGKFGIEALAGVEQRLRELCAAHGALLAGVYWCPHHPDGVVARYNQVCNCRKPAPGMLERAAREHRLDLDASWLVGDILDDVEAGRRAGCRTVLIDNGNETIWRDSPSRRPHARVADFQRAAQHIAAMRQQRPAASGAPA